MKKNILHLDGDAFFAACEIAQDPSLRGKAVVVGEEKGIATALSYEAKKMGVVRGTPIFQIRKLFPEVIIVHSDFTLYTTFSRRAMNIVRKYIDRVEEYSIDECFAEIPAYEKEFEKIARMIKEEISRSLGITFSVGIAETKVLAKIASKRNKPNGFTILAPERVLEYLHTVPVGGVWGIGPQTSALMQRQGIRTAGQFSLTSEKRIQELFHRPVVEIWRELNGHSVFPLHTPEETEHRKSIQDTRSFQSAFSSKKNILVELSHHVEEVCVQARSEGLVGNHVSFFLKSRGGEYFRTGFTLDHYTAVPHDILSIIFKKIDEVFNPNFVYKSTGVVLMGLKPAGQNQHDLFGERKKTESLEKIYTSVDSINQKFGDGSVMLASSAHYRSNTSAKILEREKMRLPLPYLGETS